MANVEDMILESIKEVKADVKMIRGELAQLSKEVVTLKTKAAVYGSMAGSIAVFAFSIIKHYLP